MQGALLEHRLYKAGDGHNLLAFDVWLVHNPIGPQEAGSFILYQLLHPVDLLELKHRPFQFEVGSFLCYVLIKLLVLSRDGLVDAV